MLAGELLLAFRLIHQLLGKSRATCPLNPESPSTQYFMTLVRKTIKSMVFGARDLKYWVLGPSGKVKTLLKGIIWRSYRVLIKGLGEDALVPCENLQSTSTQLPTC